MRYAVVSDIHANLQAWTSVLLDIRSLSVDRIICLGDIIGYGPNPREVLESVHANIDHFVLGNHDAVLCGKLSDSLFNESAREILAWTRGQLGKNAVEFLSGIPLCLKGAGFRCVHGDFSQPSCFQYVIDPADAAPSWESVTEQLLFVGHTHQPGIFLLGDSGIPRGVAAQDFALEQNKRYLVNAGSVGQPRDGDTRASYCVYDAKEGSVCWRRIPFDIDAYRRSVADKGIPVSASSFLTYDPRVGVQPLRTILSFSPPQTAAKGAKGVVELESIQSLRTGIRKWKLLFGLAVAAFMFFAAASALAFLRHANRRMEISGLDSSPADSADFAGGRSPVTVPSCPSPSGSAIPGWLVCLGNKYRQSVCVEQSADDGATCVVMRSGTANEEMRLVSPAYRVSPGMNASIEALFKKSPDFGGDIAISAQLTKDSETGGQTVDRFKPASPSMVRKGGWMRASSSFSFPAGSQFVRYQVCAKFTGEVRMKGVGLTVRPGN